MSERMYEVWWSRGEGTQKGPRFRILEDAIRYVSARSDRASFAIRNPDGTWHRGANGRFYARCGDDPAGEPRWRGHHKGGRYGYPSYHIMGDQMFVIYSVNKEDVWMCRFPLSALQ